MAPKWHTYWVCHRRFLVGNGLIGLAFAAIRISSLGPTAKGAWIPADVIDGFKAQGAGYQSRMNALLRAFMEARK